MAFWSWARKWDLVTLLECSSKQNGSKPILVRRSCTTESAAIFSATNSTLFPLYNALAIMLVMVCDFPVPGGPCNIKLFPSPDSITASSCEESTSMGMEKSSGAQVLSISRASTSGTLSCHWMRFSIRLAMMAFSFNFSALLWMSFHMTNLLNENSPSIDSSTTSQPFMSRMQTRMAAKFSLRLHRCCLLATASVRRG